MERTAVFVRHGQKVDKMYPDWISDNFDEHGKYNRKNHPNMPNEIPIRDKPTSFYKDSPLTLTGVVHGTKVGKGIKEESLLREGFQIYVSSALRCIEMATAIVNGMGRTGETTLNLKVEPGLLEWRGWRFPQVMSEDELLANGFQLDTSYRTLVKRGEIPPTETIPEFYERSRRVIQHLLGQDEGDMLIIAHAASLDALTRSELLPSGSQEECIEFVRKVVRNSSHGSVGVATYANDTTNCADALQTEANETKGKNTGFWKLTSVLPPSDYILKQYSCTSDFSAFR